MANTPLSSIQDTAHEPTKRKRGRPRKQEHPEMETSEIQPSAATETQPLEPLAEAIPPAVELSAPMPELTSASEPNLSLEAKPVVHEPQIQESVEYESTSKLTAIAEPPVPSEPELEIEQETESDAISKSKLEPASEPPTAIIEAPSDAKHPLPDDFPQLEIDPEFEQLITPLTEQEFYNLRESITSSNQVRDPIVVWNNIIVDGHNRYKICQETKIIPQIISIEFENRKQAREWIIRNQFSRRNLSLANKTYMIGKLYNELKGDRTQNLRQRSNGQNARSGNTAKRLSSLFKMEEKSIRRADEFAQVVDRIQNEAIRMMILNRHGNIKLKEILNLRKLSDEDLQQAVADLNPDAQNTEAIISSTVKIKRKRKPSTEHNTGTQQVTANANMEYQQRELNPKLTKILPVFLEALKLELAQRYGDLETMTCPNCHKALYWTVFDNIRLTSDPLQISNSEFKVKCNHCKHEFKNF